MFGILSTCVLGILVKPTLYLHFPFLLLFLAYSFFDNFLPDFYCTSFAAVELQCLGKILESSLCIFACIGTRIFDSILLEFWSTFSEFCKKITLILLGYWLDFVRFGNVLRSSFQFLLNSPQYVCHVPLKPWNWLIKSNCKTDFRIDMTCCLTALSGYARVMHLWARVWMAFFWWDSWFFPIPSLDLWSLPTHEWISTRTGNWT